MSLGPLNNTSSWRGEGHSARVRGDCKAKPPFYFRSIENALLGLEVSPERPFGKLWSPLGRLWSPFALFGSPLDAFGSTFGNFSVDFGRLLLSSGRTLGVIGAPWAPKPEKHQKHIFSFDILASKMTTKTFTLYLFFIYKPHIGHAAFLDTTLYAQATQVQILSGG